MRGGTESTHNIYGLKIALEEAYKNLYDDQEKVKSLKELFSNEIFKSIDNVKVNGSFKKSSYTILNLRFPISIDKKDLISFKLELAGIACSSGSACQSGSSEPSHVLSEILSEDEMKKRYKFKNPELLDRIYDKKQNLILIAGHYCSWEWVFILDRFTKYKINAIYKGNYTETMTSAIAAFRAKKQPHIVQVFEVGTATMMAAEEKGADSMALDEKQTSGEAAPAVRFEIRNWNAVCM